VTTTICWSLKGGSGTTVVVACLALNHHLPVVVVDLDGDLPAVLGLDEPHGQGLTDWFESAVPAHAVDDLAIDVDERIRLIPRGLGHLPAAGSARWRTFGTWLIAARPDVLIDAGTGGPPGGLVDAAPAARHLLVTRACYLALRHAARSTHRPDGVVLVAEPGRRLLGRDVERSVGAPIVATFSLDPAVARAVDSGLLRARLPHHARRELKAAS